MAACLVIRHEEKVRKKQVKSKNENKQEKRGTRNRESSKINILEIIKTDFLGVFIILCQILLPILPSKRAEAKACSENGPEG